MASLSCRISIRNGVAEVFNEDGTPSELYAEALKETGNQEEALNLWAIAYSQDFVAESPTTGDSARLNDVIKFLDTKDSQRKTLTKEQRLEIKGMMKENNLASLAELQRTLVKVFKPLGIPTFEPGMEANQLYSPAEQQEVDPEAVSEVMVAIEGELRKGDILVNPENKSGKSLSDTTKKTPLGTSESISSEQVEQDIIDSIENFQDREEVERIVDNHENYDALDRPASFKYYLARLRRLPIMTFNGVTATEENRRTYNEVITNALPSALSAIRAELVTINKISDSVWSSKKTATKKIISALEKELALHGVDIVGLSKAEVSRPDLVGMLTALQTHLEEGDDIAVERFAEIKDKYITPKPATRVTLVDPAYEGLDIVYSENSYPDSYLFEQEGLIRIGENLYHRVNREDNTVSEYAEALYQKVLDGVFAVPTEVDDIQDPNNKEELLKDIINFAAGRNTGLQVNDNVEVSLAQMYFEHNPTVKRDVIGELGHISTDVDYLKDDFISDFYKYVLKEKIKNSYAYRTILSKFSFSEAGISLDYPISTIEDIEYQKELEDYIRLKKDSSMNYLLPSSTPAVTQELRDLNDINSVPSFADQVQRYKEYVVTPSATSNIIKVDGKLYRNVGNGNNMSVFAEVVTPTSVYFDTEGTTEHDQDVVNSIIEKQMFIFAPEKLTTEEFQQKQKDNKINTKAPKVDKEALQDEKTAKDLAIKLQGLDDTPTETAQEYVKSKRLGNNPQLVERVDSLLNKSTTKLVSEYLKQKLGMGISILSNSDMRKELTKRGYSSLKGMIVGEKGASNTKEDYLGDLLIAKGMTVLGISPSAIKRLTGWEFSNDFWKLELEEPKFKIEDVEEGKEYKLADVIDATDLIEMYPEYNKTKVIFNNDESSSYDRDSNTLTISTKDEPYTTFTDGKESLVFVPGKSKRMYRLDTASRRSFAHELTHANQQQEGFYRGGSPATIGARAREISGVSGSDSGVLQIEKLKTALENKELSQSDKNILNALINSFTNTGAIYDAYRRIVGEIEARNIQARYDLTPEERKELLLSETEEYFPEEDKIYVKAAQVDNIQFLSANDKVYGFYDGSTGEIYLTEDFLNSGALIHEHFHLFKPILKEQAAKGNKDAKVLLDTLKKIVDESGAFNEAEFSARYDAANKQPLEWSENRQGKGDKKILERNAIVQQSAKDLKAGLITNEQHRQNVLDNSPIEPITTFYKAASEAEIKKALASNLVGRLNEPVEEGKMVALRLDIPAYQRHNTWVVTVHSAKTNKSIDGLPISFSNVARITNVTFNSRADKALAIATGAGKDSFIRINGNWKNFEGKTLEEKGKEAEALVDEIKDNPEWVQVGTNPFRQSFFYDRANGIPVKTAEEVVQIGGLVYAKNVEYGNLNDPEYTVKGLKDAAGNPVQFSIIGEKGAAELDKFEEASTRLGNLAIARDMEAAGMDSPEIRLATGWEKGVDGLWKYEILDGTLKMNPSSYKGVLSDVFENEELYKAYPSLKDVQVDLKLNGFGTGNYTRNKITVNGGTKDMLSILIHEIQHAIQSIEGFARGGNMMEMSQFDKEIESITSPLTFPKLNKEERAIAREKTKSKGIRFSEVFYYDAQSENVDKLEDAIERLDILNEVAPNSTYTALIDIIEEKLSQILMGDTPTFDRYQRIAGEVEARNVQKRLEMSPEERRNTLLSETADIDRKDQLILFSLLNVDDNRLSSEAYNPRPGESKEDYLGRMREEVEANLLGDNSTEYFQRIAEENNFTEAQTKTFLQRIKAFIGKFSKWITDQLGFKNITPEQAAAMTTKEALDRITTSMLRGDFGALDIKNGIDMFSIIGRIGAQSQADNGDIYSIEMYTLAQELDNINTDSAKIKQLTGWEKGVDGKWRYELDTQNLNVDLSKLNKVNTTKDVNFKNPVKVLSYEELIDLPEFYAAYPNLKNGEVVFYNNDTIYDAYEMFNFDNTIYVNETRYNKFTTDESREKIKRDLIHEITHSSQAIEGFAKGGNTADISSRIRSIILDIREGNTNSYQRGGIEEQLLNFALSRLNLENLEKLDQSGIDNVAGRLGDAFYMSLAGEVEARAISDRVGLTKEEKRNTLISANFDTSISNQNVWDRNTTATIPSVEVADIQQKINEEHTNSVAFMNSVGFKLLIKTDIKQIDNC